MIQPFTAGAQCFSVALTTVSSTSVVLPNAGDTIRLVNEGPNTAYVSIGTGPQVATVPGAVAANTCTPVLAGSDVTFSIPPSNAVQLAAVVAQGSALLNVQVGNGV
jgi:hypothetical protein